MTDHIPVSTTEEQRAAVLQLAQRSASRLLLLTDALEPCLYDTQPFVEACRQLVIRHERCRVEILVKNAENLKTMDHRLLPLIQRLPSRMKLRICHADDVDYPESFMLADRDGVYLKRTPGRGVAYLYEQNPRVNAEYERIFRGFWERASTDMNLARLAL